MLKTIVINSAKGGVGKTKTTTELAKALQRAGEPVAILDLDVTTPNIGNIPGVTTYSSNSKTMATKAQIKKLIRSTVISVSDGWLLIDTPPTISELYLSITEVLVNTKFIFVTTPSENAITDTAIGIRFFTQRKVVPLGIIQNMVGDTFGKAIDSVKEMGLPTLGEVPLTTGSMNSYFNDLVKTLLKVDFQETATIGDKKRVLSNLTIKEAEVLPHDALKFYNLKTWDVIRSRILYDEEESPRPRNARSHYDISTKALAKILSQGSTTTILVTKNVSVVDAPMLFELQEAEIVYDEKYAKGLPMFKLQSGVLLWHHECSLPDEHVVADLLESGIDLGNGRIIQCLHGQLYYHRAFTRSALETEYRIIERHIEITSQTPTLKELMYIMHQLEQGETEAEETFIPERYIEAQRVDYPEYYEYLYSIMPLATNK